MDEVHPDIFIGNLADSQDYPLLQTHGIRSVLSLRATDPSHVSTQGDGLSRTVISLIDGPVIMSGPYKKR